MPLLALISIVLAIVVVLIARLPRPVPVLVFCSVTGAVLGVIALVTRSWNRECDFSKPPIVDRCSGTYVAIFGERRLPQFMQGRYGGAWQIGTGALFGVALAVVVALMAMWAWSRLKTQRECRRVSMNT